MAAAALAVLGLLVLYVLAVRTHWGQRLDDAAYDGRRAVLPETTRRAHDFLGTITATSLLFLGLALMTVALARRRPRLSLAVGVALGGSVVTSEVLKHWIFTRATSDDVHGIRNNSFPSGHATIGMSLSLGLILVVAHHWRWLASIVAAIVATLFGTGVLTVGWHRPSDVFAAYLVSLAWYSAVMAVLIAWRGRGDPARLRLDTVEERATPVVTAVAGLLLLAAMVAGLVSSLQAEGLRAVRFSLVYAGMVVLIDVAGVVLVAGFHLLMRDVSSDPPPAVPTGVD